MAIGYDTSLTFGDLKLRVAEAVDVAPQGSGSDNRATAPTDPNLKDRIERAINDAARQIAGAWRWTWLSPTLSITLSPDGDGPMSVNEDPTRYRLPACVNSAPFGRVAWKYPAGTSGGGIVTDTHIDRLVDMTDRSPDFEGPPQYCAVRPIEGVGIGDRPGIELLVWPKPDQAYVLTSRFRVMPTRMVNDAERPIWPEWMDDAVIAKAVTNFLRPQDEGYGQYQSNAAAALSLAKDRDGDMRGKRLTNPDTARVVASRSGPIVYPPYGTILE